MRSILLVAGALACAVVVSGCAGNESYPNLPKPPAFVTLTVFVGEDEIAVSPNPLGAGPTRFIITNQTGTKQNVLVSAEQSEREVTVGQGQTANFRMTIQPGELSISADNTAAQEATMVVGPERESAQDDLNQP